MINFIKDQIRKQREADRQAKRFREAVKYFETLGVYKGENNGYMGYRVSGVYDFGSYVA